MRKIRYGLVLAIVLCILMAGLAIAAGKNWGLMDFFAARNEDYMAPEVTGMIQRPDDQVQENGQTAFADITVREVLFDGTNAKIVVNVAPRDDKTLIVLVDSELDDPLSDLGELYANETTSIREYARRNGKEVVCRLNCFFPDSPLFVNSIDNQVEEDGSMTYYLGATAEEPLDESSSITMRCRFYDLIGDTTTDEDVTFTLNWSAGNRANPVSSKESVVYDECGVRVDSVKLEGSPMGIRATIHYTVLDQEKYASLNEPCFALVDGEGNRLPMDLGNWENGRVGVMVGDITSEQWWADWEKRWNIGDAKEKEEIDPKAFEDIPVYTQYEQTTTLPAAEAMPKEIILAVHDWQEDALYQAKTIPLSE